MSKISELSDGGALQSTDYLIAVRSGGNVKVQPNGTVTGTTGSFSGNVTFADSAKAIFGAGSDLQIYHDGSNSYVTDAGTGDLRLSANNLRMQNADNTVNYIKANNGSNVELFFNNASKLATTATGIDVTGTVTADGLTVDAGASDIGIVFDDNSVTNRYQFTTGGNSLDSYFNINSDATRAAHLRTLSGSVSFDIASGFGRNDINFIGADLFIKRGGTKALEVDQATGDISFFEDTGTTPKFFWDASAESLGIGTSSPDGILDVEGSITIAGSQAGVIFNPSVTPANNKVGSVGLVSGTLNAPASANASSKISGLRVAPTTLHLQAVTLTMRLF